MSPVRVESLPHPDASGIDNATSRSSPAPSETAAAAAFLLFILTVISPPLSAAEEKPSAPIIEHGPRGSKMVALTFDACATGMPDEFDEDVAAVLLSENVPATLFISGRWAEENPDWVVFLAQQPSFEIANHTIAGVLISGRTSRGVIIRDTIVHHARDKGIDVHGSRHRIQSNVIFMIGNNQEAMGIHVASASDCLVQGNDVFLCKKTAIRDQSGKRNTIQGNLMHQW